MEYPGAHEALIDAALFREVQAVLDAHRTSGERAPKHHHYLTGSIYCARCQSKMMFSINTGRGGTYEYYVCLGRHTKRTDCDMPALQTADVERAVAGLWQHEQIPPALAEHVTEGLLADIHDVTEDARKEQVLITRQIEAIQRERMKWAEQAIEGNVPRDIAQLKQAELATKLAAIERRQVQLVVSSETQEDTLRRAVGLLPDCGDAYQRGSDRLRRAYNQAWFSRIYLDVDDDTRQAIAVEPQRNELFQQLTEVLSTVRHQANDAEHHSPQTDEEADRFRDRPLSRALGLNFELLVGAEGLEPPTLSV